MQSYLTYLATLETTPVADLIKIHSLDKNFELNKQIKSFDNIRELFDNSQREFFIDYEKYSVGDVNVNKIVGQDYYKYIGKSWLEAALSQEYKIKNCTNLLQSSSDYYEFGDHTDMYYISVDYGATYYSTSNGNHRTIMSKIVFALEEKIIGSSDYTLKKVNKHDIQIHYNLKRLMEQFNKINTLQNTRNKITLKSANPDIIENNYDGSKIINYKPTYYIMDYRYRRNPIIMEVNRAELIQYLYHYNSSYGKLNISQRVIDFFYGSQERVSKTNNSDFVFNSYLNKPLRIF